MAYIYKISNEITDKIYIGKTIHHPDKRLLQHFREAKNGSSCHVHKAIRAYGEDAFKVEILESCPKEMLDSREQYWIAKLGSFRYGYNMTSGGDGGDTSHTPGYIEGMKNRRCYDGEGNPMYGKTSAMKGKKHKEESIEKMSSARKEFWSEESRKNAMAERMTGERNPMFGRRPSNVIPVLDIETGTRYNSKSEAIAARVPKYRMRKISNE